MKKYFIALLAVASMTPALAHHGAPHYSEPWHNINSPQFYPRHNHPQNGWGWVVPVLLGGAIIGYEWSRIQQPIYQQPQVVVVPQPMPIVPGYDTPVYQVPVYPSPVYPSAPCGNWREVQQADGRTYRERICRSN